MLILPVPFLPVRKVSDHAELEAEVQVGERRMASMSFVVFACHGS